ncbi:MAG: DHA2 family efflux MFS transporter permease subunit [Deltaproteobacteria bacterium]|nr:DHA2 family efflux MFS transporter permease subunit [Deltaproteobacteria bacterium]
MAVSSARARHSHPGAPLGDADLSKGTELRPADYPSVGTRKWLIAGALILGQILTGLDMSIVNVALPYMQGSFHVGIDRISWVVTSYFAAVGMILPLTGWIAVRVGRKRYLLVSVLTFVIASAFCGLAGGILQMVAFRILQGAAGAAMMPLSQAILLETFPPEEHTLAMTTSGIGMMLAPVLGPTIGGWITLNWSWRWNFYINLPMGMLAALMMSIFIHDPSYLKKQRGRGRVDYVGIICVVLALGVFQIVLGRGGLSGWFAAPWVRYASAVAAAAMVVLIIHELHFPEPVIEFRLLKSFGFALAVTLICIQSLVLFSVNLLNPLFMENVLGYSAWRAGLAVAPRGIGVILALVTVGQLSRRRVDMRRIICWGFVLAGWEIWQMAHWPVDASGREVLLPIFLFGLGLGGVFPTITALGLGQIPRERMGFATSLFGMIINSGAATGIAIVSNALISRHSFHQAQLANYSAFLDGCDKAGLIPAAIYGSLAAPNNLAAQAWLLAYHDMYTVLALVVALLAPWCLPLVPSNSAQTAEKTIFE